jgi:hypothetical protein
VALLIPILAGLTELFNSYRMMRLPDPHHRAHRGRRRPLPDDCDTASGSLAGAIIVTLAWH